MCLITDQQEPFIAEIDITVYKELYGDLSPVYHITSFKYILNKLHTTMIKESGIWATFDMEDEKELYKLAKTKTLDLNIVYGIKKLDWYKLDMKCFGQGFHSALTNKRLRTSNGFIYQCTIPKGSEYYTNPSGLVISNQLIINKLLD